MSGQDCRFSWQSNQDLIDGQPSTEDIIMLRSRIQALIENNKSDPKEAAIQICLLLEDRLDLSGNGWFGDDPELEARFDSEDEQD
jgi:hypothetical protein